ncbi:hypothetical protein COCMIDRAFT_27653 [Bipolaris oryzae ATCC 44560]|uniref:Uncharacterized protein n=1 Tax=Bipolaris oryzae ATCC 44560 TaxID=930090 RepID=W6Z8N4_COCMI|nr:uncharacterized protein COCMIDRAFT_27653 [Bipolaris oryzae ATCC 44560]EUC43899.1 hypothetical protein COCMIDRAFT_27653 [Bipolaris oryzae ATCC 44560]
MKNLFSIILFLKGVVGLRTIKKDVIVVGGGSSGIYTGISLVDAGKDVVIVEKSSAIGSHANTYYDPIFKTPRNVGVQSLPNISVVNDYLTRVNVTAGPYVSYNAPTNLNVDYMTGLEVKNYTAPSGAEASWKTFRSIIEEKYSYLEEGFFLPDPVPDELLLPFSQFSGNFAPKNVDDIYINAAKILGDRVLLSSTVQSLKRSESSVTVIVKTPSGRICYEADKIAMAAPPLIQNFAGWDLSSNEFQLFSKFQSKNTHIAITRNPEWNNASITGVGPSSSLGIARLPGAINTSPTGFSDSSYFSYVCFIGEASVQYAQTLFKSQVQKLIANGVLPASKNEIVEWFNHDQYMNFVSNEDIKSGFYTKLNDLQGTSSTYYVGAIWAGQDSAYIWGACKRLLPKILA